MEKSKKDTKMTYAVAINSSGQATIPKAIRDLLGVVPGENRLTFDVVKGKVVLGREKSRAELLDESLQKIWASNEEQIKTNPKYAAAREKYKGMTYREIMEMDDAEENKRIEEKYGIKL